MHTAVSAEATAAKCDKAEAVAGVNVVATAVARAYAEAVTKVDAYCDSTENSSACAWGEGSIAAMAKVCFPFLQ
jgi:hypothetical protein